MLKRRYDVHLVHGETGSKVIKKKYRNNFTKYNITKYKLPIQNQKKNIFGEISAIIKLFYLVRKINPDILHTISPKANLYGGLVGIFFKKIKFVMSISGVGTIYQKKYFFLRIIYNFLLKVIFLKKNKYLIFHNSTDLKKFKEKFKLKKDILYKTYGSGVDLKKTKYLYNSSSTNILFAGRVMLSKGIIEYAKASIEVDNVFPDWKFLIAGTTDYKNPETGLKQIRNKVNNSKIKFLGFVKNKRKLYKDISIFCLPSHSEGLSRTLLEASAFGIPIITSDIPGSRDIIRHRKTGLLFKVKDSNDLIKKIFALIKNKSLRKELSQNCYKLAKDKFGVEKVLRVHETIYTR